MTSSVVNKPAQAGARRLTYLVSYVLFAVAVLAAYSNVYHNAFFYDDQFLIVKNRFLRDWHYLPYLFVTQLADGSYTAGQYYRPLQNLLYMIVFHAAGLSTVAFHFLNISLHIINACLLYKLGRKLAFDPLPVFLAALLWALHPVHVEAVTYMSATADTLYTSFCLLGVIVLLPDVTRGRIMAAIPLMILALLSKESAITFPLLAASCLYLRSPRRLDVRSYIRLWPLLLTAFVYAIVHHILAPPIAGMPASTDAAVSVASLAKPADYESFAALPLYLRLLVWPAGLRFEHGMPVYPTIWDPAVLAGFGLILAVTLQIMRRQTATSLPFSWGLLWFAAAHLPAFNIHAIVCEHFMYLPSIGLILGSMQSAALSIKKLPLATSASLSRVFVLAVLSIAFVFGSLTWRQNKIWREPVSFYENIFRYGESSSRSHVNLGIFYAREGKSEKALEQYQLALAHADDHLLAPGAQASLHADFAITLLQMPDRKQRAQEALDHLQKALKLDPNCTAALDALSHYYANRGNAAQAALYGQRAKTVREKFITPFDENPVTSKP